MQRKGWSRRAANHGAARSVKAVETGNRRSSRSSQPLNFYVSLPSRRPELIEPIQHVLKHPDSRDLPVSVFSIIFYCDFCPDLIEDRGVVAHPSPNGKRGVNELFYWLLLFAELALQQANSTLTLVEIQMVKTNHHSKTTRPRLTSDLFLSHLAHAQFPHRSSHILHRKAGRH